MSYNALALRRLSTSVQILFDRPPYTIRWTVELLLPLYGEDSRAVFTPSMLSLIHI